MLLLLLLLFRNEGIAIYSLHKMKVSICPLPIGIKNKKKVNSFKPTREMRVTITKKNNNKWITTSYIRFCFNLINIYYSLSYLAWCTHYRPCLLRKKRTLLHIIACLLLLGEEKISKLSQLTISKSRGSCKGLWVALHCLKPPLQIHFKFSFHMVTQKRRWQKHTRLKEKKKKKERK